MNAVLLFAAATALSVIGCTATNPVEPSSAVGAPNETIETPEHTFAMVDATILFTDCSHVFNNSAALAEKTMRRLVEGCDSVPGGHAQFIATLLPGGRIEISAVDGTEGTVPICVLRHQLQHKVSVRKACKMHVQMEQKAPTPQGDAGALGSPEAP